MESIVQKLIEALLSGGAGAVVAILTLVIVALVYDRFQIKAEIERRDKRIDKLIDDFYDSAKEINTSLGNIKEVLIEIKGKLSRYG